MATATSLPNPADLPVHVKMVPRINQDRLRALDSATQKTHDDCVYTLGWANDISRYQPVLDQRPRTARDVPYTKLSSRQVGDMLTAGIIREIDPSEVRGAVHVFGIPERNKNRARAIRHTRDINDVLGRDTLLPIDMANKATVLNLVLKGDYAVQCDFAAYYDTFECSPEVGLMSCFKKGRRYYCLTTPATGARHTVELAHSATMKIKDFKDRECYSAAVIDNVIFVGNDREAVRRDGERFVERAKYVNATINEDTSDVSKLVAQNLEWYGIVCDFENKRTSLSAKLLAKLRASWNNRHDWTYRQVAFHFGLLFWAVGIVVVYPGDYFRALQHYASMCSRFAMDENEGIVPEWDTPASVSADALEDLERWTETAIRNRPRIVSEPAKTDPDWLVCVDACRRGWGYIAVCPRTGETRSYGAQWAPAFAAANGHKLHRSVFTEPHGVVSAMCHLLTISDKHQHVRIWTDSVTMCAGNKGYNSRSEDVNTCIQRLNNVTSSPSMHVMLGGGCQRESWCARRRR